ncbi:hypothetical protein PG997_006857 [Apiospora hydei]|uniref:Uncharacterized protein n=1 Tax=Apiospora hydei TaxID=1337664 RepID=A0ABR1WPX4_9PEZI
MWLSANNHTSVFGPRSAEDGSELQNVDDSASKWRCRYNIPVLASDSHLTAYQSFHCLRSGKQIPMADTLSPFPTQKHLACIHHSTWKILKSPYAMKIIRIVATKCFVLKRGIVPQESSREHLNPYDIPITRPLGVAKEQTRTKSLPKMRSSCFAVRPSENSNIQST